MKPGIIAEGEDHHDHAQYAVIEAQQRVEAEKVQLKLFCTRSPKKLSIL
jgi:hypothetical protein